jgi:hypothetical protein
MQTPSKYYAVKICKKERLKRVAAKIGGLSMIGYSPDGKKITRGDNFLDLLRGKALA